MNKPDQHKALSKRFEEEAEAGFRSVPGSEAFFNELKNPFTQKKYRKVNRSGNMRFLVFELLLMTALLFLLKYTWMGEETAPTAVTPIETPQKTTPEKNMPETAVVMPEVKTEKKAGTKKHFPPPVIDAKALETERLIREQEEAEMTDVNSPGNDSVAKVIQPEIHHYSNYRSYYKLRYLNDVLVVDYGDSVTRLRLKPVLGGIPANLESDPLGKQTKEKGLPFVSVKENIYLQKLEEGIRLFKAKEWEKADQIFLSLWKENGNDQNALFYGALCRYENGIYEGALFLLEHLSQIQQPVFEQDVDYYMALSLAKTGHLQEARESLKRIAHSDSFYKEKAALLVKELK